MKHMAFGKVALLGVFAVAGCYSYVSEAINNGDYKTVEPTPEFLLVKVGDSSQVIVRLVNDARNGAITNYTVSEVGAGILVHQNLLFRPVFDATLDTLVVTTDKTAQQFYVVGVAPGQYTFKLTPTSVNTSVSKVVTVIVQPRDLPAALSKHTGAPGDTVVITAGPGTVFSQTSAVSFATGTVAVIARAADSTTITIVVSGGITGPATVTNVGIIASPTVQKSTLITTDSLVTPVQTIGAALSATTAAVGATITLTAPPNYFFSSNSVVTFTTGAHSTPVLSADSTRLTFLIGPGVSGPATITNVGLKSAPTLPKLTFTTTNTLTTPPLVVAPTTVSNAAPAIGVPITVTLGGNLRFLANSHVLIGGVEAGLTAVSADSSTATITPLAYSTGTVTYTNIALSFLNSVALAVPGDQTVTVGAAYAGPTDAGAGTFATATTYTLRKSLVISDNGPMTGPCPGNLGGGATCRYYKVTVPAGSTAGRIVWDGPTNTDLGVYTVNAAGTSAVTAIADDGGLASGTAGDSSAPATLTAGTIGFVVMNFGPAPAVPWFQWRIVQQ